MEDMEWFECSASGQLYNDDAAYWIGDFGVFPERYILTFVHGQGDEDTIGRYKALAQAKAAAVKHSEYTKGNQA